MPIYKYKGIKKDGTLIKGEYACADVTTLKTDLGKQKIKLESYKAVEEKKPNAFFSLSGSVSANDFVSFVTQLSIMIKAGMSISDSLRILATLKFPSYFKKVISYIHQDVLKGTYLSKAMEGFPDVFPSFFVSMVYVGELSGNLPLVLNRSTQYYENDQKIKKKMKSSMIYPTFLMIIVFVVFILLMLFVVPQFVDMINSFGGEVPVITLVVMDISNFITTYISVILLTVLAVTLGSLYFFKKTRTGKEVKDWIGYYFPIASKITRTSIASKFCSSFSILLSSGMQVIDCLAAMPKIIDNTEFTKRCKKIVNDVNEGETLTNALEKSKMFPDVLIKMTSVGETSASLETVYEITGKYYETELETALTRTASLIEPITIVILGVVVLVVILAVMLPSLSLMETIG